MKLNLRPETARARLAARAPEALAEGGEILLCAARARCPVETGRLRESGYARPAGKSCGVGFSAPYALFVHEKGAKFLEGAANDSGVHEQILTAFARLIDLR